MSRLKPARSARRIATALATCGLIAAAAPAASLADAPTHCTGADTLPAETGGRASAQATLCLINEIREGHGRGRLRANERLAAAAGGHARDMVANRYFSHDSLSGLDFVRRALAAGYTTRARMELLGENLAWGSGQLATPEEIVDAWMRSPGHRANILRRGFREIGIAVADGTPAPGAPIGATYASSFGTRAGR